MKKFYILFIFLSIIFVSTGCTQKNESRPKLLIRWATSCSHCIQSIPVFEEEIYNTHKGKVDISLHTLSDSSFITDIPQKTGSDLEFEKYTNQPCSYIPSWVIIDGSWIVVESSCGWEKDLEDMQNALEELF